MQNTAMQRKLRLANDVPLKAMSQLDRQIKVGGMHQVPCLRTAGGAASHLTSLFFLQGLRNVFSLDGGSDYL